jgi:hypothetical protein
LNYLFSVSSHTRIHCWTVIFVSQKFSHILYCLNCLNKGSEQIIIFIRPRRCGLYWIIRACTSTFKQPHTPATDMIHLN